jgi:hypothetical protein
MNPTIAAPGRSWPADAGREQAYERQARRQHHRRDHHLPREQKHGHGDRHRGPVLDERVVVQQRRRPRCLGGEGGSPRRCDRAEQDERHAAQSHRANHRESWSDRAPHG